MWNLDGVVITDVNSGGASSSYYDFNAFEEGEHLDRRQRSAASRPGWHRINFVTRRGTNKFKGNVYVADSNDSIESTNLPSELANDSRLALPGGGFAEKANHTDRILNRGLRYRRSRSSRTKPGSGYRGASRTSISSSWSRRRQDRADEHERRRSIGRRRPNDQLSGFYFNGAKEKFGRNPGYVANEPASFTVESGQLLS
jgi:hypothetical protein